MPARNQASLTPALLVIGSMISLTLGASIAKSLFHAAGPSGISAVRIGVGAFFLALWWRPWCARVSWAQGRVIVPYGLCLGAMNLLFYHAVARLPIGLAIAIEFLGPLSIALLYSKKISDLFWAMLAGLGVVLILPLTDFQPNLDPAGILFAAGAGAAWAIYIILGKKAGTAAPSGVVTTLGMGIAFVSVLPFGAGSLPILFSGLPFFGYAVAVGILSSAIPYSLEMVAMRQLPERYFSLLLSLEPAIGSLLALTFLGERLSSLQLAAIACVVAASVGSSLSHRRASLEPTPQ